jgi:hypothetical protein
MGLLRLNLGPQINSDKRGSASYSLKMLEEERAGSGGEKAGEVMISETTNRWMLPTLGWTNAIVGKLTCEDVCEFGSKKSCVHAACTA